LQPQRKHTRCVIERGKLATPTAAIQQLLPLCGHVLVLTARGSKSGSPSLLALAPTQRRLAAIHAQGSAEGGGERRGE
jgi:hypothetical protein